MQSNQLWDWLLKLAMPILKQDLPLQRGEVVTARELAVRWCDSMNSGDVAEATEITSEVFGQLIESGEYQPAKCPHGKLRAFDECRVCGHAVQLMSPPATLNTAETRKRIWTALAGSQDGLTRGEIARLSETDEKSVTWAVSDWMTERSVIETGETRRMPSGRSARVVRCVKTI